MALPDLGRYLWIPGRLAKDPTSFSTVFPHGGTALGDTAGLAIAHRVIQAEIPAQEFGTWSDSLYCGERWSLAGAFHTWDADAINTLFPNTSLGAITGERLIKFSPTAFRAGQLLSSRSVKLIFTPDDPKSVPAIYFRNAAPLVDEAVKYRLSLADETFFPFVFLALPHDSGNAVEFGFLEDLAV